MSALPKSGTTKRKPTLKQEKWMDVTIETLNPTEGAVQAYNVKDRVVAKSIACENLAKPYLREAIQAKQAEIQIRNELTVDSIVQEFEVLQALAVKKNQLNVAATALTNKAKVAGLWVERTEDVTARPTVETLDEFIDSGVLPILIERYQERLNLGENLDPLF